MKIYVDLIILLNFFLDFLLLLSVSLILRRNTKIYKLLIGAFLGGISVLSLFIKMSPFELFILKSDYTIFIKSNCTQKSAESEKSA